ncbi:MAG: AraC family transcriptional regulator [Tannerellaceae bacterium]|nr:AraC family transcriptional regulator [Tannerellaceae bacterium]
MNIHEKFIHLGVENYRQQFENMLADSGVKLIISDLKMYENKVLLILAPEINTQMDIAKEGSKERTFMDKVMQLMQENYHNPMFDVPAFAVSMGISKTLLNRKLRELTGVSTGKFIHNYRLQKAKELLLINKPAKEKHISEIAYEVGFNDPKYFTRCFREFFGVLPSLI